MQLAIRLAKECLNDSRLIVHTDSHWQNSDFSPGGSVASKYKTGPCSGIGSLVSVHCTLCTACMEKYDVVLVVCTTDAAPIFKFIGTHEAEYMALGV